MLSLEQIIAEATVLPDTDKTILIEKLIESMAEQLDKDLLLKGIQKAQERLAEIDNGTIQAIPGDIALAQIRQFLEP
ncbi:addiction module protein [Phormidium sp. FACHB-1136]|uniref:addiction module protein n=1 Tax=Phormidium sp. FACHB-1136 TaxID=2692848 RepID=UPI0016898303|nr:addiction module protein [Phormidium sp. FACHB-1136]MBD2424807.1 addiction module protein [Phormidium sp. FACHB-1136]